jgi:hypothetical protein
MGRHHKSVQRCALDPTKDDLAEEYICSFLKALGIIPRSLTYSDTCIPFHRDRATEIESEDCLKVTLDDLPYMPAYHR